MPLPSRRDGEDRGKFVSRCVSFMTKEGEGKDTAQRVAICNSRATAAMWVESQKKVTDLSPPLKKKKKDKYRNTKKDGSGTDF